ncbi:MAG: soluble NSF attachment family protein, partial [Chthoniobacterales bacterium]|nr:soluble NSF attachment family protein [Chthoniobacterales bacterium]
RDLLEIVLAEENGEEGIEKASQLAESFLTKYPHSEFVPVVQLKLADYTYRRGDFLAAKARYDRLAQETTDPAIAVYAWFFAGKCAARLQSENSIDEAIQCYEEAARYGGELGLRARFEQAMIYSSLGRYGEAIALLERVASNSNDPILKAEAFLKIGDNWFTSDNPQNKLQAIEIWKKLGKNEEFPIGSRAKALLRAGLATSDLGNDQEALSLLFDAFEISKQNPDAARTGDSAAFEAARLLEKRQNWKDAVAVYEEIARQQGPRSLEAKNRAVRILLENEIWK